MIAMLAVRANFVPKELAVHRKIVLLVSIALKELFMPKNMPVQLAHATHIQMMVRNQVIAGIVKKVVIVEKLQQMEQL